MLSMEMSRVVIKSCEAASAPGVRTIRDEGVYSQARPSDSLEVGGHI